ncbi:MAG: hypothetical protein GY765_23965 [bacterium]|nr:hypothetical protein [bacterium]
MKKITFILILFVITVGLNFAVSTEDDACTTITVGKNASYDGSVMTTHTCDSRKDRTWFDIVPAKKHKPGTKRKTYLNTHITVSAHDLSKQELKGEIAQVPVTHKYLNTALPCLNEHQVAIGEATFGGKKEMRSDVGLIDYYELNRLMLERAKTAREAIAVADEVTAKYGYIDGGECFTIADPKEVWHLEILGPGKGKKGAVWVARRVPDGEVSVNANASRIMEIDLSKPDYFMASKNYKSRAVEMGLYKPESGKPFRFCYAYASRKSMAARRREWRVFNLLAPKMDLDPNGENFPFSIVPEKKVHPKDIMVIYRDTYEGTPFDMTKFMIVPEMDDHYKPTGKYVKSAYANPFMHYDMMPLLKVNGGWNEMGERCIARYYCTYATVIQVRSWLPNEIGGIVWFGYDNPAMLTYAPVYAGIESVPASYKISGRTGYNLDCAWWAFNRVADLSAQKWGEMRHDVAKVRDPLQKEILEKQVEIEKQALELYKKNPKKARKFLTEYTNNWLLRLEKAYWKLGDDIWTKYTGKF